jgi:hypothetical protein
MLTAPIVQFEKPVLTKVTGKPTYISVTLLTKEVYANAKAIRSNHGGGLNGHLGVVMSAPTYYARANVAYIAPAHPGTMADQTGATAAQIEAAKQAYRTAQTDANLHEAVNTGLKAQIVAAVNRRYIKCLEDEAFGLADVQSHTILEHLQTKYVTLTDNDLEANRNQLSAPFNPADDIETLWDRIEFIQTLATKGNEAISDKVAMNFVLAQIELTGVMTIDTQAWRKKSDNEKTMDNFQEHFEAAIKEHARQLTTASTGYHGADIAIDLATPARQATPAEEANAAVPAATTDLMLMFYCWSHGLSKNPNHTGCTCTNRKDGHIEEATVTNMLGGCNYIARDRGPAHRPPPRERAVR